MNWQRSVKVKVNELKFSIIAPVYNVEKYLPRCVESILCQSFTDYEFILVDDGSPDNCAVLCDNYSKEHQNIKVVHKKNGGLSSARNAGIDAAEGEYIIFIDSDDFWDDSDALKNISSRLEESNADVLIFPAKRYYEEKNQYTYILNVDVDRNKIAVSDAGASIRYMLENNVYRAAAWNKVIRKSIVNEHQMRFKEGYLSEDMDWCGDLLLYARQFDFYEVPFYCYRQQRAGSITKEKSEKLVADKLYMCEKGYQQAIQLPNQEQKVLLASYYAYEYSVLLGVSAGIRNKELILRMKKLNGLLKYDVCNKVKKVNMLKKYLGYGLTRRALCLFVQIKN